MTLTRAPSLVRWSLRLSPLLLTLAISAQAAEAGRAALTDCQALTDRNARFECYDKAERPQASVPTGATQSTIPARIAPPASTGAASTSQSTAAGAAAGTAKVATVPTEPAKKPFYKRMLPFGWGDDKEDAKQADTAAAAGKPVPGDNTVDGFGLKSAAKVQTTEGGIQEMTDTIASVKMVGMNPRTITLSSGQVWRQMYDKAYLLEAGDQVQIRPSTWGDSYRLYSDRLGGFIQVERIDNKQ